ncbi:hypothetical protein [Fodinibius salicampi]|nr:hypothetical protein [Fodinibius salicampi]
MAQNFSTVGVFWLIAGKNWAWWGAEIVNTIEFQRENDGKNQ